MSIFNNIVFNNITTYIKILFFVILPLILFVLLFFMGKDIGQIYKSSQSQLSTSSLKAPVSSSSDT